MERGGRVGGSEGVTGVGGMDRGEEVKRGGMVERGVCVGVLIHSSVQTARLCPSLPIPLFHQVQASCLSSLHLGEKGGGRGGALVITKTAKRHENWCEGKLANPAEFCHLRKGRQGW